MVNERLNALSSKLLSLAGTSVDPAAKKICDAVASSSLDRTVAVVAEDVHIDAAHALPLPVSDVLTFDELLHQPQLALTARLLIGLFDATRLITREHVEVVEQLFFTRPRGTYGFVFVEASRIKGAEDLERVLRTGWRLLVPEPKPRWLHQNLAEHDVFLFDDRAAIDDLDLPLEEAREGLQRLAGSDGAADHALARSALLYAVDITLQSAEALETTATTDDAVAGVRYRDAARDELASVRMRLIRRIDSEGAALLRVMETAVMRLRRDLIMGLDAALGYRGAFQKRTGVARDFQRFLHTTIDRWLTTSQGDVERRVEDLARELAAVIRGADWSPVNRAIGDDAAYPQPLLDSLRRGTTPVRFAGVTTREPQPPQRTSGLPYAGLAVVGSGIVVAVTALAGAIPAILTSVVVGAGGWALYHEQDGREQVRQGQGVIHGITEQMRVQVEDAIDSFVQRLHAVLKDALRLAQDQVSAATPDAPQPLADMTRFESLRDEIAAVEVTTPATV
jgi:hypothetical protein